MTLASLPASLLAGQYYGLIIWTKVVNTIVQNMDTTQVFIMIRCLSTRFIIFFPNMDSLPKNSEEKIEHYRQNSFHKSNHELS
jgi:hypothetical protein